MNTTPLVRIPGRVPRRRDLFVSPETVEHPKIIKLDEDEMKLACRYFTLSTIKVPNVSEISEIQIILLKLGRASDDLIAAARTFLGLDILQAKA